MTLLRSREIVPTIESKCSPKTQEKGVIETTTPAKTLEPSNQRSNNTTPCSNSVLQVPGVLGLEFGSGSDSVSVSGTVRRRSLRLASKPSCEEITGNVSNSARKRKITASENSTICIGESDLRSVERDCVDGTENLVADLGVKKAGVSDMISRRIEVDEMKMSFDGSVSVVEEVEVVTRKGESGLCFGLGSVGQSRERGITAKRGKVERKSSIDVDLSGLKLVEEGERDGGCLNLRSGIKIGKKSVEGATGGGRFIGVESGDGDKLVQVNERGRKGKGSDRVLNDGSEESFAVNESERVQNADANGALKGSRRFNREEKGKAKLDAIDLLKGFDSKVSDKDPIADENGNVLKDRKLSRKEKGKAKVLDDELRGTDEANMDLVPKVEKSFENAVSGVENIAVQDRKKDLETDFSVNSRRIRDNKERFRDIARQNAARFAHFSYQDEQEDHVDEAERAMPQIEADREMEDWPGPFSTAMKIIKDRELNLNVQQPYASLDKNKYASIVWVPKKDENRPCPMHLTPSLQELCMGILATNADSITSLDSVPDVIRHKLSQLLCDSRKMNNHFLDLLVRGSPTEIRIRDCSWLSEEQFSRTFEGCDTINLTVLQLDQCGRCVPDYILCSMLARFSNCLPALTTVSFKGACRLSDVGLSALVASTPALRSINLGQCSLLTSDGINSLADSLGSVLKELYIDDCQSIDAMLVLPALARLEHLEVLSVAGIETVCDDFISAFVAACGCNIKELVLTDCVKLTDSSLKVIAATCSGLCAIDLSNLSKLTDSAIGYLANDCRTIHTLKLCRNAFSDEAIAAYLETCGESLKELSLNNVNKVAHNTAISLARHSRNLLTLDLSWCRNLTNEALGLIVDSCLSLKVLKLFGCTQVTSVFLGGHSNPQVQIIGMNMTPILEHLKVLDPIEGPLHYSSVSSI